MAFKRKGAQKRKRRGRHADAARYRGMKVKPEDIDYKNVALLQRLTSAQGKMFSRKRTGLNAECQRQVAVALKRARFMAMMPYVA